MLPILIASWLIGHSPQGATGPKSADTRFAVGMEVRRMGMLVGDTLDPKFQPVKKGDLVWVQFWLKCEGVTLLESGEGGLPFTVTDPEEESIGVLQPVLGMFPGQSRMILIPARLAQSRDYLGKVPVNRNVTLTVQLLCRRDPSDEAPAYRDLLTGKGPKLQPGMLAEVAFVARDYDTHEIGRVQRPSTIALEVGVPSQHYLSLTNELDPGFTFSYRGHSLSEGLKGMRIGGKRLIRVEGSDWLPGGIWLQGLSYVTVEAVSARWYRDVKDKWGFPVRRVFGPKLTAPK